ncbi:diguanylate cyclase [Pseudomonas edaphica]|jgi:diguanylate cyclase (GGDEF)-like protein|uniref:Diguanylate cyclase n=1 Tax=Pseudomonas edaphica TaxID=2006980 RepID=A0A5R8R5K5_9PSED|nr:MULTISPECIES: diguanylate cyclase [Pseudomonas]MCF5141970.1 diguanylate cyclase [Pseudomonas sp. PA-6-3C]MCF5146768.1 diguanylate cyclase [Pseudomonas sp. PA-6-3F]MCF5159424.1 diguanylate cyclase [Pseudomonas sp. PA-6-2E]MCF5174351.1 diguanylate cyclase [Pseudomonas sp. PA-6-1D]MCF5195294.1 diguanylate cyclase [Pseudomonas sp. PA-6-1H]
MRTAKARPTLRSVIGRGHLILALVAVTLASVSLTLLGVLALRVYAEHNLHLIARSINYTVEAAVVFDDSAAATEALSLIASTEEVAQAEVFDANGKLLAQWVRPETGMLSKVELAVAHTLLEQPISQPVLHQGQPVGSIHLVGHGGSLLRFLLSGLAGILICTALSAWVALYLARRLLQGITQPLQSLAAVAHAARSERDFDRRVPPAQIAELDSLGSDFNALLGEMEAWQSHLQSENETLAHQASHDSLTGLPNRAFFEGRLIRALRSAAKINEKVAVLFLDSDRFKDINDNFGHAAGDAVLVAVAERVRAQLREDDLVARLGGDEFAILLAPLHKAEDAQRIADKIIASMDKPIPLPGNTQVLTSLSIGIAIYPDHGATPGTLLNAADAAMYQAKRLSQGGQQTAEAEPTAANVQHRS